MEGRQATQPAVYAARDGAGATVIGRDVAARRARRAASHGDEDRHRGVHEPHPTFGGGLAPLSALEKMGARRKCISEVYGAGVIRKALRPVANMTSVVGSLDLPLDGSTVESGEIEVAGWALDGIELPMMVVALVNGTPTAMADREQERLDVAAAHPDRPNAARSGWRCVFDIDASVGQTVTFEALILDNEGALTRLGPSSVNLVPAVKRWRGRLDRPIGGEQALGVLRVAGWCDFGGEAPATISVLIDDGPVGRARLGIPRSDVAAVLNDPAAVIAGFEATLAVPESLHGREVSVVVVATAKTGETWSVGQARITCFPAHPPTDADWRAASSLRARSSGQQPRPRAVADTGVSRLLVAAHSVGTGGAQRWLTELLRQFRSTTDVSVTVLSMVAGQCGCELEDLGCEVVVTGEHPLNSIEGYEGHLELLANWLSSRPPYDAVLLNTIGVFPMADLAQRLGLRTVWAVHESYDMPVYWNLPELPQPHRYVRARGEESLREATLVLFVAEATERLYRRNLGPTARLRTLPAALDLSRFAVVEPIAQGDARQRINLPPSPTQVVLCLGTIEPRKGQTSLVRAFLDATPSLDVVLAIVGEETPGAYLDALRAYVDAVDPGGRVRLEPVTSDPLLWLRAADLLVSGSDVESLPLVVLEAMAAGVPVLATDVFGVPELIDDGKTGWLTPSMDEGALAGAIRRALATSQEERRAIVDAARERVHRRHDLVAYAAEVWDAITRTD